MIEIRGLHLTMDGFVRSSESLQPQHITQVFDELVEALGMQYLQAPLAAFVPSREERLQTEEDEGGWSVFAQITTSHIAIHCWPARKAFMLDVFSCKTFDGHKAKRLLHERLNVTTAVTEIHERLGPLALE